MRLQGLERSYEHLVNLVPLGVIEEWTPRGGVISGVGDAMPEFIDARVHSTMLL
jgi:hypothetical protein